MKDGKVAIVVPIYNVEKYIKKCITSLVNQTFKDIEIWAISDGSPDNSGSIVKEMAKNDERIRYIEKENGGYGSVLGYAIQNVKTEYLLVCDPDDWMEPNAVETLYLKAKENNLDLVMGEKYLVYNDGERKYSKNNNEFYNLESNYAYTDKNIEKFAFCPVSPHSKLFKVSCLKNIIFPHKVSYTDNILFLVALKYSNRIMKIDVPLSYYLIDRPGNTMTDRKPKSVLDRIIVWNSILNQIDSKDEYIIFWLYKQLKYFTKLYCNNSEDFLKDELFEKLLKARNRFLPFYKETKNKFTKGIVNKLEIYMVFHSEKSFIRYIKFRKFIKK